MLKAQRASLVAALAAGCATTKSTTCPSQGERPGVSGNSALATSDCECSRETLADVLEARGITLEEIDHLRYVGTEQCCERGAVHEERDRETIEWIWFGIQTAEPYSYWVASGNIPVEIYLKGRTDPAITLYVNETDSTGLDGHPGRYMCHDLHDVVLNALSKSTGRAPSATAEPPN